MVCLKYPEIHWLIIIFHHFPINIAILGRYFLFWTHSYDIMMDIDG